MLKELDECFCTDTIVGSIKQENGCLYPGAMDLSKCLGERTNHFYSEYVAVELTQ